MLSTLANIGEFIGGIAVLVTIVYFAIQLRANLNANRAQALASWTAAAQSEKDSLFRDPVFSKLYLEVVIEGQEPQEEEAVRFYAYCIQLMNSWQLLHTQCKYGVVDTDFLDKTSIGYVGFVSSPVPKSWWGSTGYLMYDTEFVEYVNETLKQQPTDNSG